MRPTHRRTVVVLVLLTVAAVAPSLVAARPLNEIPVTDVSPDQASQLAHPTSDAWTDTISVEVPLSSAASTVPNAEDTSVDSMTVRTARTDDRLFVRLSWRDGTRDAGHEDDTYETPRNDSFADGAAVQLPVNASSRPSIAMGSPRERVNVWYWNGEKGGEELIAGGPGSTTRFSSSKLATNATYEDGRWHIVFVRERTGQAAGRTSLAQQRDVSVAFAVWNGSNLERSGRKAVSEWHYFKLASDEGAAFYETLLWAIAGLAIVFVVVVTAVAVRRTN